MTVKTDTNLGTIIPVILFLTVQTGGGIWWAATLTANLQALSDDVQESQLELRAAIANEEDERIADRRRIFDRIVDVEAVVNGVTAENQATRAIISALQDDLALLREDLRENNGLIRRLLGEGRGLPTAGWRQP